MQAEEWQAVAQKPEQVSDDNWHDDADADRLRDEAFRRLLDVPPKPQKDMKAAKSRARGCAEAVKDDADAEGPTTLRGG